MRLVTCFFLSLSLGYLMLPVFGSLLYCILHGSVSYYNHLCLVLPTELNLCCFIENSVTGLSVGGLLICFLIDEVRVVLGPCNPAATYTAGQL